MTVLLALVICGTPLAVMYVHGRRTHRGVERMRTIRRHPAPFDWTKEQ